MDILHRIDVLKTKHKELHARVEAAEAENAPDQFLTSMKKEKLNVFTQNKKDKDLVIKISSTSKKIILSKNMENKRR